MKNAVHFFFRTVGLPVWPFDGSHVVVAGPQIGEVADGFDEAFGGDCHSVLRLNFQSERGQNVLEFVASHALLMGQISANMILADLPIGQLCDCVAGQFKFGSPLNDDVLNFVSRGWSGRTITYAAHIWAKFIRICSRVIVFSPGGSSIMRNARQIIARAIADGCSGASLDRRSNTGRNASRMIGSSSSPRSSAASHDVGIDSGVICQPLTVKRGAGEELFGVGHIVDFGQGFIQFSSERFGLVPRKPLDQLHVMDMFFDRPCDNGRFDHLLDGLFRSCATTANFMVGLFAAGILLVVPFVPVSAILASLFSNRVISNAGNDLETKFSIRLHDDLLNPDNRSDRINQLIQLIRTYYPLISGYASTKSELFIIFYPRKGSGESCMSVPFFCRSDDCRVFGWGDKICGLGCLTKPDGNGLDYLAMNFSHAKWSHLSFPGAKFVGKNLVPIQPGADGLHILQRVSPPVVWKVKMEDGTCSRLFGGEIDSESIGQLRGGAAALSTGETITGWGHRTRSADCHTPFYYEVSRSSVFIEDIDGMEGINDPTSAWDDKLLICHTEKAWTVNQPCEHRLYRVIQ